MSSWDEARREVESSEAEAKKAQDEWRARREAALPGQRFLNKHIEEFVDTLHRHNQWPTKTFEESRWFSKRSVTVPDRTKRIRLGPKVTKGNRTDILNLQIAVDATWALYSSSCDDEGRPDYVIMTDSMAVEEYSHILFFDMEEVERAVMQELAAHLMGRGLPLPD